MINFQRPAFPDLNSFCNKHLYTKLLSQFRAVHSYSTRNTRTGKQNCLKLLYTYILSSLVCFAFIFSYLLVTCWHFYLLYWGKFYVCISGLFVITRISLNRGLLYWGSIPSSVHFIVIFLRWRKSFVIPRRAGCLWDVCWSSTPHYSGLMDRVFNACIQNTSSFCSIIYCFRGVGYRTQEYDQFCNE